MLNDNPKIKYCPHCIGCGGRARELWHSGFYPNGSSYCPNCDTYFDQTTGNKYREIKSNNKLDIFVSNLKYIWEYCILRKEIPEWYGFEKVELKTIWVKKK